jgi:hypothetical protein
LNISITGFPSGVSGEFVVNESDFALHPKNLRFSTANGNSSVPTCAGTKDDEFGRFNDADNSEL